MALDTLLARRVTLELSTTPRQVQPAPRVFVRSPARGARREGFLTDLELERARSRSPAHVAGGPSGRPTERPEVDGDDRTISQASPWSRRALALTVNEIINLGTQITLVTA